MNSYCIKCKTATPCVGGSLCKTNHGRHFIKSKCAECKTNKSSFVSAADAGKHAKQSKKKSGSGLWDEIKSAFS